MSSGRLKQTGGCEKAVHKGGTRVAGAFFSGWHKAEPGYRADVSLAKWTFCTEKCAYGRISSYYCLILADIICSIYMAYFAL